MKNVVTIACCFICLGQNIAQPDIRLSSYPFADSIALKVKYRDDLARLSKDLTSALPQQVDKVRSIYRWITHNIAYDYKFINKEREVVWPDCDDKPNCKEIKLEFEKNLAHKTAAKKKGTAEGFAYLFKKLCTEAGVTCEVVKGGVRTKPYQAGNNTPNNHFWNAVYIGKDWYFIDAMLSAGIIKENDETGKLMPFERKENDVYFLSPYEQFRKDHCPEKANWQAILGIQNREKFNRQPFYYNAASYVSTLSGLSPDTGFLNTHVGDTIEFSFTYPHTIDRIQVNTNLKQNPKIVYYDKKRQQEINTHALKRQVYLPYERDGDRYSFKVSVTDRSLYYIDILFKYPSDIDATKVLRYRVNVPWN